MVSKAAVPLKHHIDPSGPGYNVALSWQHEQRRGRSRSGRALDLSQVHRCVDQRGFLTQDGQTSELCHSAWGEDCEQGK